MYKKTLSILVFMAALSIPRAYAAGQDYIVTLTNGNTITANSYRLEGRKVYLKYPVGEVAIPASEVAAVTTGDGSTLLLQVNGDLKPSSDGTQEAAPSQAALPGQPSNVQGQGQPGQPSEVQEAGPPQAGAPGGISPDNNPADDGQAAEIRKRLDNNLDNLDDARDSTNGAGDPTQQ
jgi:hypothetical protein